MEQLQKTNEDDVLNEPELPSPVQEVLFKKIELELPTSAILFNGPPESGKDLACQIILEHLNTASDLWPTPKVRHVQFKDKLIELTCCIYSVDKETWDELYKRKEEPTDLLDGESPRSALIKVSEKIIKPNYGSNYFGKSAAKNLIRGGITIFSDSGFDEELVPVYEACEGRVLVVKLYKEGCSFKNRGHGKPDDSRNYLNPYKNTDFIELINSGDLKEYKHQVIEAFWYYVNKLNPEGY